MAEHYYTVGKHGAPTPETAPHGYKWRLDGPWICSGGPYEWHPENQWWPLPAPPTEQAPPPEPVARWTACNLGCGWSSLRCGPDLNHPSHEDATAAADALNTLDRDGVAWGEMRPPETLPETGRVLVAFTNGHVGTWNTWDLGDRRLNVTGWWPLPEVTP